MTFQTMVEDDGWGKKSPHDFLWDWWWVLPDDGEVHSQHTGRLHEGGLQHGGPVLGIGGMTGMKGEGTRWHNWLEQGWWHGHHGFGSNRGGGRGKGVVVVG